MLLLVVIRGILFFQETQNRLGEEVAQIINIWFEDFDWLVWYIYDINLSILTQTGRQGGSNAMADVRSRPVRGRTTNTEPWIISPKLFGSE